MSRKSAVSRAKVNKNMVAAYSSIVSEHKKRSAFDSFQNPTLGLGMGGGNALDRGFFVNTVNQNFNWLKLRSMYSSNWLARRLVEMQAEDMTREGVQITGSIEPDDMKDIYSSWDGLSIQKSLFQTISMARLYGGAIAYIDIDGQLPSTPLDLNTVRKDQFRGLKMFDRWQLSPSIDDFDILDNKPNYYTVLSPYDFNMKFSSQKDFEKLDEYKTDLVMHRSRVIRLDGDFLPFIDFLQNQRWYASILVNAMDVITSYLTASSALSSASYKSSLRVVKVDKMYEVLNQGEQGQAYNNLMQFIQVMKLTESTENITVLGSDDSIEVLNYDLNGLMMSLDQFERQISSLSGAPATKLLGETAKGLNATGDNETRMYYDKIKCAQEDMRPDILNLLNIMYVSTLGKQPPEDFNFNFTPLWQLDQMEKADISEKITGSVNEAYESGLISKATGQKELLQSSDETGIWTNITDEDISDSEKEDEDPPEVTDDMIVSAFTSANERNNIGENPKADSNEQDEDIEDGENS